MSYILDALREAESGRQPAPAPSRPIVSDMVPAAPVNVRRRVLWVTAALAVGVALVAATLGWRQLRAAPPAPAQQPASAPAPAANATNTRPLGAEVPERTPATAREPARALDLEARRARAPAPTPVAAPAARPPTAAERAAPNRQRGTAPAPGRVTVMSEAESLDARATDRTAALAADGATRSGSVTSDAPLYQDLLLSGRLNLPNLRMDMHVYNSDARKRFVFINLRKYREGERVEDRATIETITRDGAVLEHNGVRFVLLPD